MKKKGSAIVTIIIVAVVFLIYVSVTYADISHLEKMHNKYSSDIQKILEDDINSKINML